MDIEERLIDIESAIANLEKTFDELNEVVVKQQREIEVLRNSNKYLAGLLDNEVVKPLSEETPPPHY